MNHDSNGGTDHYLDQCASVLIDRCSYLVMYYHRRDQDKSEMFDELKWLSSDAERWGVRTSDVGSGVLEELLKSCDRRLAYRLYWEFFQEFGTATTSCSNSRREANATDLPLGDEPVAFARGWRKRTTSAAHPH